MAGPAAPHRLVLASANLALPGRMSPLCTQRLRCEGADLGTLTTRSDRRESLWFKVPLQPPDISERARATNPASCGEAGRPD